MKKRGFTLLELLAVIVILAIIALIAVPIILNVIDETKKKAIKESANGYLDAVEKAIVLENVKGKTFNDGTYYIKNGDLYSDDNLETKILDVKVKGDIPNGSDLNIEKGRITSCYLTISNYPVTCDANNISVGKKGEILARSIQISEPPKTKISKEETLQLQAIILPEAANNKITWKSSKVDVATVSETGLVTGVGNGTTTITATTENNKTATIDITVENEYGVSIELGTDDDPYLAIVYLDPEDLKKKCDASNSSNENGVKTGCMKWYSYKNEGNNYSLLLAHNTTQTMTWSTKESLDNAVKNDVKTWNENLNARLISATELVDILNITGFDLSKGCTSYSFDVSNYPYIIENTSSSVGYWTNDIACKDSAGTYAFAIGRGSSLLDWWKTSVAGRFGIRPVITVSKEVLGL